MSRAEEMRELFARWEESGQSLMAFGKQEGVRYAKLLYWKRKFGDAARPATGDVPELVPVEVVGNSGPTAAVPRKFEVWLSNGVALDVPADFDADELRRLIGVLQSC